VINRVSLFLIIKKISYELWVGGKLNLSYFKVFNFNYFMLNEAVKVIKFDSKSIKKIFVGYSSTSKVYRVYIPTSWIVIESLHVKFNEVINFDAEKGHSIIGNGVKNINTINESQTIIVENIQKILTTQDVPTIIDR
jgi:hypothetical protein